MSDYALTNLGPHRFEELSQALALKTLGPSVQIFGDGPDGGREASFQGLRHFPTPEDPWTGYGVLQAKFRRRPEGTAKDADWLIEHINDELRAWANPRANRVRMGRLPAHLLITTNVVLSPVPGSGGIDRVQEALRKRVKELQLPLTGWEIWHYDKICRLLDNNEGVRHAYADAVLSGDVLAHLNSHIKKLETAHHRTDAREVPSLPRELRPLFGRETEIAKGRRLLEQSGSDNTASVVVTGPPGIGKSAVALRISRLVADVYPDGQFHIDLALSASEEKPADLVLALLQTLQPNGESPPEGRAQQLAMLRARLSSSKVLLFIDDIVSEEALLEVVRMDGPFAIICTSRAKLSGLTGLVNPIELGPLPIRYSKDLIKAVAGRARLTDEQMSCMAEGCAGHPLALQIAAAHLARRPKVNVDRYLDEISNPDHGLRALRAGQASLEPVIEPSFAALTPDQAELFTTLGILPHMSVTPEIVAVAIAPEGQFDSSQVDDVRELLDSLFELSFIEQVDDDRFMFHEILHRFARLKSVSASTGHRESVIRQTCLVLAARTKYATESIGFLDKEAKVPAQGNADALQELNDDRPGAIAVTELARQYQMWGPLVLLVSELTASLWHSGHWHYLERAYNCVLEAGRQSDEPEWTAAALHNLAMVAGHLGDSQRAVDLYQRSAEMAYESDNPYQLHISQLALGSLLINLGRARDSIPYLRSGLPFWRLIEDDRVLAQALGNLGQAYLSIGQYRRAEQYLQNSRNLSQSDSHADLWNRETRAALLRKTGRLDEAAREASLDLERARSVGSREWEARALAELAETPPEERPGSAPVNPLENALAIYRETGDIQGQVRTLYSLGRQSAERADIGQAAEHLRECVNLAVEIGNYEHAARSLAYIASYRGGVGHLEDAEKYFADAREMARYVGSPVVLAHILQRNSEHLRYLGKLSEAITLLREAIALLEGTEAKEELAQARTEFGEALIVEGRWQEGAEVLASVVSVMSDDASPSTRAEASRALAILYSRRGLHNEAISTITKALDQCEQADDESSIMHCRMALGNVHARHGEWSKASDQYDKAAECAAERTDLRVLLIARGHAAVARLNGEDKKQAVTDIVKLIPFTKQLGMQSLEAMLHANVGAHHAESGDHHQAIAEFHTALAICKELGDNTASAPCLLNLARAHRTLGETDQSRTYAREAFTLHQQLDNWSEAGEALLLLGILYQDVAPDAGPPTFNDLLGTEYAIDIRVLEAVRTRLRADVDASAAEADHKGRNSSAMPHGRRVNISDAVRKELDGIDIDSVAAHFSNSREKCMACNLSIDEMGEAEMLLLLHKKAKHLQARLAHPHCAASQVIQWEGKVPQKHKIVYEVECILFGGNRAGIVVDCHGGLGSRPDGQFVDFTLEQYMEAGFVNLRYMLHPEDAPGLDPQEIPDVSNLSARLEGNELSISDSESQILSRMPLNFLPRWYMQAFDGELTVIVGRNLQGMAADDPSYLMRAIELGKAVGGVVPLTVVRPSRNSPCPCMMRSGKKFKRCCGSSVTK